MERLKPADSGGLGRRSCSCEALLFKNDSAAREMEGLPSYVEAAKGSFDGPAAVIEGRPRISGALWRRGKRPDGSSTRPPTAAHCRNTCARARASWMSSATWAPGACARRTLGAREVHLRRQLRGRARVGRRATPRAIASKLLTQQGRRLRCARRIWRQGRARFDIVIIDPPAFAKRKKDLPKALAAYKRLNQLAMQVLRPRASWYLAPAPTT